jgi:hypothetical protein
MMSNRHQCHNPSLCVTCADHADRHQRHTPLEGVTIVTLVDKVPMPSFYSGGRAAGGGYAFALCKFTLSSTAKPCAKQNTNNRAYKAYQTRYQCGSTSEQLGCFEFAAVEFHLCTRNRYCCPPIAKRIRAQRINSKISIRPLCQKLVELSRCIELFGNRFFAKCVKIIIVVHKNVLGINPHNLEHWFVFAKNVA